MAIQNFLMMKLLRLITPEEVSEIATKHNGGRFLSLTDLVNERIHKKIYRNFSHPDSLEDLHEPISNAAADESNVLAFRAQSEKEGEGESDIGPPEKHIRIQAIAVNQVVAPPDPDVELRRDPNDLKMLEGSLSSFIITTKEHLKNAQNTLKKIEVKELYQKNSEMDVEQIKVTNKKAAGAIEQGVLINKKQ